MTTPPRLDSEARAQQFYNPDYCAFCAKHRREVFFLVQGPAAAICDECIELSAEIIAQKRTEANDPA